MNAKPGMLCRVVSNGRSGMTPGFVDRIVEVLRPAVCGERFMDINGTHVATCGDDYVDAWVVTSPSPLPWANFHDDGVHFFHERTVGDEHLRPIGGVPIDEEILDEVCA
jgi:hypothetical protein